MPKNGTPYEPSFVSLESRQGKTNSGPARIRSSLSPTSNRLLPSMFDVFEKILLS